MRERSIDLQSPDEGSDKTSEEVRSIGSSLLLATLDGCISLLLARNDLAQHDHTVAIHECDTGKAFAILEAVAHKRLLRHEAALGHLVGFQGVWLLHLLATGLLAHLPGDLRDTASGAAAAHKANR